MFYHFHVKSQTPLFREGSCSGVSLSLSLSHFPLGGPQVGYLFDHPGTVFFSIFMSFWAVTFLEYWKRKNATLAHHWDCTDFQEEEASEA